MIGRIDDAGRALVRILLRAHVGSMPLDLEAWIDTGFTGELVLPKNVIDSLKLVQSGTVDAELGDGSAVVLKTYSCRIDWFGREQSIEIVGNNGSLPLIGVGLLWSNRLTIDYPAKTVVIE
ncbi:MAG: hypothetical protein L0211_20030 [Planctomycetaceae bacterium]|nr:hypothetical protein [Planctomycetaceae bacterium]